VTAQIGACEQNGRMKSQLVHRLNLLFMFARRDNASEERGMLFMNASELGVFRVRINFAS